jgi:hypothetical protein
MARKRREKTTVGLQALEKELRYEWRERERCAAETREHRRRPSASPSRQAQTL